MKTNVLFFVHGVGLAQPPVEVEFIPRVGDRVVLPNFRDYYVSSVVHDYSSTPNEVRIYVGPDT